jgi:putative transposase
MTRCPLALATGWRVDGSHAHRTDVVGMFPDDASLIRLVSMLAIEANDEWLVGRSYISQKSMATLPDAVSEKDLSLNNDKEVELIAA